MLLPRRCLVVMSLLIVLVAMPGVVRVTGATTPSVAPRPPRPPEQPANGPGGMAFRYEGVSAQRFGTPPSGFWLFEPTHLRLDDASPPAHPLPVVIFIHGYTALDPDVYRGWIDHIVRRGTTVIYPDYQRINPFRESWRSYPADLISGVADAFHELGQPGHLPVDPSRVAVVGHSLGGVLAIDYAATAKEHALPVPSVVMAVQPGGCGGCRGLPDDQGVPLPSFTTFSPKTLVEVIVGEDDDVVGDDAARIIWSGLSDLPVEQRDYITLRSDLRGFPFLRATHWLPQTAGFRGAEDALDWYGPWKLLDLLTTCAFTGAGCEAALNDSPEQRSMGVWSDGQPVTEAIVSDGP